MVGRVALAVALGVMSACSRPSPQPPKEAPEDAVVVKQNAELRQTDYTIASGDCRITWTISHTELNRGGIRHRSDCGLPLAGQAPLIGKLLRKVLAEDPDAAAIRTLGWGRLHPDGARDFTMPGRLALAAKRSAEWDARKGASRGGEINGWVLKLANEAAIYEELRPVFAQSGLEIRLESVEKVLVQRAEQLAFFDRLREAGAEPRDRLPFDCQAWFSVRKKTP